MARSVPVVRILVVVLALLSAASTTLAAQEPTPLAPGDTLSGTLAPGDTLRYAVETEADFFVRARVNQVTADVVVRVLGPDGQQLRRVDGPARGEELLQFETDTAGVHQIQVLPSDDEEGDFTIVLERLEPVADDPEELADQLLSAYDGNDSPGAAVRVWRDGETLFTRSYGMANLAYGIPFEADTRTNIGSTSKQFTAFAVLLLAERGALSLDDPVTKHLPEVPAFDDTVRVRHLLTHTTGYREIYNLLIMAGRRLGEGDYVDRDEILTVLRSQPALQNAPGAEFNYNNTAYALAAMLVAEVSGRTFPDFMAENVFGPLGMDRTLVRPHPEAIVEERSTGYAPGDDGGYREIRDLGAAMGAGAIYSTVADLQKWVENYREPRVGSREMIDRMTTSFVTTEGDTTGYGLGLMIDEHRGLRRVHHGGADIAHRSMLVYYPEIGAGLTTQSNHAGFDSGVAFRLAEAFFGDAMEPEEDEDEVAGEGFDPADYDPEDFDPFTGRYALEADPAFVITLSRDGETLYTQATGQPELTLTPTSDTTFALDQVEASLTVHVDEEGEAEAITLHQGGRDQRAERLPGDDGAWAPGPETLEIFTGRYLSRELETFYEIVLDGEGLVAKHRRLDDIALEPGEEDTFSGENLVFGFERDRNGQVIGFYLSNGRTRNVRFERVP